MAGAMSEIILCEDSEITAVPAVVKKNGSPQGCGTCGNGTDNQGKFDDAECK